MLEKFNLQKHRLFFIFSFIFVLKFIFVRYFIFNNVQLLQTIWVEIFYLFFIFIVIEFIQNDKTKKITYIVVDVVMTTLLIGLVLYFKYSGQVVSILMLSQLNQVGTVKASVFKLIHPMYFVLILDLLIMLAFYKKLAFKKQTIYKKNYLFIGSILLLSIIFISSTLIQNRELFITNAKLTAESKGIFTFEIVTVVQKLSDPPSLTLTNNELQQKINDLKQIDETTPKVHTGELAGRNVIFIQLEAFQNFLIHTKVDGKEITPFLNSLVSDSMYFSNIYQQIASGSTSDAEFLSNTSLYPSFNQATTKAYSDREIPSFPRLLEEQGYETFTMHANEVEFWNRINLYPALGFQHWYDVEYYGEDDVIGIGLSDKTFFNKSLDVLIEKNAADSPFYAQLITLSSHHPFVLPEEVLSLSLPSDFDGSIVGDYLKAAQYVDSQLKMFFEDLDREGILDSSVVVLYGDHQGLQVNAMSDNDLALLKNVVGHDYTFMDQYNIPFIIHAKNSTLIGEQKMVGGQIDMMPTVANLIDLDLSNYVHFGEDLLNNDMNLFGMRYYMPYGSFFYNNFVYMTQTNYEDGQGYDLTTHIEIPRSVNLSLQYKNIMQLLELNDRYLNSLPLRKENVSN